MSRSALIDAVTTWRQSMIQGKGRGNGAVEGREKGGGKAAKGQSIVRESHWKVKKRRWEGKCKGQEKAAGRQVKRAGKGGGKASEKGRERRREGK